MINRMAEIATECGDIMLSTHEEAGATVLTIEGKELDFTRVEKSSVIAGSQERIEESDLIDKR